jgi:hypothetical protein
MLTGKRMSPQERAPLDLASLDGIVATCLRKDPDDRWQSAGDIKRVLELIGQASPLPGSARKRSYRAWIAAAAFLALAIYFYATGRGHTAVSGEVVSFAVYPPEKSAFSAAVNITVNVPQFSLSPDGRTLAFVANTPSGAPMLWLRRLAGLAAQALPGTENVQQLFWSPDNRWLGFFADGKVKKVPAAGGAVQVVAETRSDFRGGAWGADDTILFASGAEPVYRVNAAGGEAIPTTTLDESAETDRFPVFLPDGRHFLYLLQNGVPEQIGVYAGSLDRQTKKLLLHENTSAVYAPGGYLLYVDGDTLMGQAFDAPRLATNGRPFLVAEHAG